MGRLGTGTRRPWQGSAPAAPGAYRDDPDDVSLHTTEGDYEYNDAEPPAYSDIDPATSSASPPSLMPTRAAGARNPSELVDQYNTITPTKNVGALWSSKTPWSSKAGIGDETSMRMDERLMQPDELHTYITKYLAMLPVRPFLSVQGTHHETRRTKDNKTERKQVTDFFLFWNLQHWMNLEAKSPWWRTEVVQNSDKAYRGSFRKTQVAASAVAHAEEGVSNRGANKSLGDHCFDFCSSKSPIRVFRVARQLEGMDVEIFREEITRLIRATHYRGTIDVQVTLLDRNVDIYSPHWVNRLRMSWVRYIFYVTFLWLFTWPVLFFTTKWWSVYDVVWRFSAETASAPSGASERGWLRAHAQLIQSLALERFNGDATRMPTDVVNSGRRLHPGSSGNQNIDNAVSVIRGGVDIWNAISGRPSGMNGGGWGGDS